MYGRPFGRVFLIASITYFGLHFLWWHLYVEEKRAQKQGTCDKILHDLMSYIYKALAHLSQLEKMLLEITSSPQSTS